MLFLFGSDVHDNPLENKLSYHLKKYALSKTDQIFATSNYIYYNIKNTEDIKLTFYHLGLMLKK